MRSVEALMDLTMRADRVIIAMSRGDVVRFAYPAKMVIAEMSDVILEMAERIAFLEKKARDEGERGKRELAADLIALQDENFALKNRIKDLAASLPKQTHTHHAVDNIGSSSSLEAMVGCGASYRGKTQIGVGSYQAKKHGVNL